MNTHFELSHGQFSGNGYRIIEVEVGDKMQPFQVLMGTNPEEVAQWREERRKNWPTKANLARKEAVARARDETGSLDPGGPSKKRKVETSLVSTEYASDPEQSLLARKKRTCEFWLHKGSCRNGDSCQYQHDPNPPVCKFILKGKCSRGRKCTFSHNPTLVGAHKAQHQVAPQPSRKPTLLRKLLTEELRRESSLVLQSLRMLVESDFFFVKQP